MPLSALGDPLRFCRFELAELGDSVKADDLQTQLKGIREDAVRQLKDRVHTFLNSQTFLDLSPRVTFGYFYTAFAHRQEDEKKTWAISTPSRRPPLQMVDSSSSSSSAEPTIIDLDDAHLSGAHVGLGNVDDRMRSAFGDDFGLGIFDEFRVL